MTEGLHVLVLKVSYKEKLGNHKRIFAAYSHHWEPNSHFDWLRISSLSFPFSRVVLLLHIHSTNVNSRAFGSQARNISATKLQVQLWNFQISWFQFVLLYNLGNFACKRDFSPKEEDWLWCINGCRVYVGDATMSEWFSFSLITLVAADPHPQSKPVCTENGTASAMRIPGVPLEGGAWWKRRHWCQDLERTLWLSRKKTGNSAYILGLDGPVLCDCLKPRYLGSNIYFTRAFKYPLEWVQRTRGIFNSSSEIFSVFNKIFCRGNNEFSQLWWWANKRHQLICYSRIPEAHYHIPSLNDHCFFLQLRLTVSIGLCRGINWFVEKCKLQPWKYHPRYSHQDIKEESGIQREALNIRGLLLREDFRKAWTTNVEFGREQEARLMWSWIRRQELTMGFIGVCEAAMEASGLYAVQSTPALSVPMGMFAEGF